MATADEFAQECRETAKNLRRVEKDLRRTLSSESKEKIAVPLAAKVSRAATGPWAHVLSAGTKARAGADPTIVVGGMRPRLSGGAGPRQVVFGAEFGGGSRVSAIPSRSGRRGYRRHTTAQFRRNMKPFVFPTVAANLEWVLETFADITLETLDKGVNSGG